jgi:uncharacterized membrane protein
MIEAKEPTLTLAWALSAAFCALSFKAAALALLSYEQTTSP